MATEAKLKAKEQKSESKTPAKSSREGSSKKQPDTQFPQALVANHRFPVGTKVGFWSVSDIGTERSQGREPFPKPTKNATVKKDGTLQVSGLERGSWCAAALLDGAWLYVQFEVK